MTVTAKEKAEIKKQGFANTGGIPRTTYWTPDGRTIQSIPSWREFRAKDAEGNVTGSGVRDANLDKGWLPYPPQDPKPYCAGCDKWHDTEEEVIVCIADKQEKAAKWEEWARREKQQESKDQQNDVENLRVEVLELKGTVYELIKAIKEGR